MAWNEEYAVEVHRARSLVEGELLEHHVAVVDAELILAIRHLIRAEGLNGGPLEYLLRVQHKIHSRRLKLLLGIRVDHVCVEEVLNTHGA
jgi:hypothetical protein